MATTTHTTHRMPPAPRHDGHSTAEEGRALTDVIKDLRDQLTTLVRDEVELAKSETSEKVSKLARNGGYLAGGGAIAMAGLVVLLLGISAGLYVGLVAASLTHFTAGWLAPVIVGLVVCIIGYAMAQKAINTFRHESIVPEKTIESVREDAQWMKGKVS